MSSSEAGRGSSQYLTFCIDGEEYAVAILQVREILQYEQLTRVPSTPAWIRGVMNLRGSVVPVADLAAKLGGGSRPVTRTTCIVILEVSVEGRPSIMGILADSVDQVVDLATADIQAPPAFGTRIRVDFLAGMASLGNRKFVLILDIERLLSADELLAAGQAGEGAESGRPQDTAAAVAGA
jgi:purine-binding chemotaxis protein CheW